MKKFAEKFYKSKEWLECRSSFYNYRFGLCERCGGPGLIVHHKELLTPNNINDPNITLNWDKLELLCQDCHNKEHMTKHKEITRDGLVFNDKGELIKSEY